MKLFDNLMNSSPPLPLTTSLSVNWQPIFYGLLYTLLVKIDPPFVPPDVNVIPQNPTTLPLLSRWMMTGPLVPQKSIEESLVSNLRGKWVSLDIIIAADEWKNQGKKKETFVFV